MVKCCLGTWRAEGGSPHTDHKGYVLPETTTMHSLPYTTLAQRKRDNMYKKKRKGAQREKPDKQAKRPGTSKQEDSLVSHNNRGTKPTTITSIRGDLLVRPSKGEPNLSAATRPGTKEEWYGFSTRQGWRPPLPPRRENGLSR